MYDEVYERDPTTGKAARDAQLARKLAHAKLARLRKIIRQLGSVVVAYSGGVDSTFLMRIAAEALGKEALAVTARSETYPEREGEEAVSLAARLGFRHRIVDTSELAIPGFRNNPPERCYYCKSELFKTLREIAEAEGFAHVAEGSTSDDLADYRPGRKAALELEVVSPLLAAELSKKEIRFLSRELGIPTWDKPAFACLASRFPYYEEITAEKLSRISRAEEYLRSLGIRQCRVRHHGSLARIEVEARDMSTLLRCKDIAGYFRSLGFTYVTIDLEGYRQGSMNAQLQEYSSESIDKNGPKDPGR